MRSRLSCHTHQNKNWQMGKHLLVLLEKVWWLKEFGPFSFSLKDLVCDAKACRCTTQWDKDVIGLRKSSFSTITLWRTRQQFTVFELLAHDGARRRGDIVRGVLLGVGGGDDGHQVVSVGWVHLKNEWRKKKKKNGTGRTAEMRAFTSKLNPPCGVCRPTSHVQQGPISAHNPPSTHAHMLHSPSAVKELRWRKPVVLPSIFKCRNLTVTDEGCTAGSALC